MPNHCIVITFTMVKFPLSFAAFTEVLIDVYIDQKFTQVGKLCNRGKNPKCKHGIKSNSGLMAMHKLNGLNTGNLKMVGDGFNHLGRT